MVNYLLVNARYDHSTKIHSNNLQYEKRPDTRVIVVCSLDFAAMETNYSQDICTVDVFPRCNKKTFVVLSGAVLFLQNGSIKKYRCKTGKNGEQINYTLGPACNE